jgi:dimethylsulfone monooxygenase
MTARTAEPVKFAYWVPNVSGGLVISNIEQRTSWTIDYNRKLAQIAEASGFDYALSSSMNPCLSAIPCWSRQRR